jgi:cell division transport system ATP-binding protein
MLIYFQADNLILSDVSFSISKGEFVYIIGKVGSGKTSIIKTINAELPLKSGEALVAGYNLGTIKKAQVPYLRRKLGIVFQDFQLLSDGTFTTTLLSFACHRLEKQKGDQRPDR